MRSIKKGIALLMAMAMAAALPAAAFAEEDSGDHYPGFEVYYREGDPEADLDVEITSDDVIVWTVADCVAEDNPQSVAVTNIANALDEMTDGKFTWDVYYNSELGSETEAVELCRNNTVQFVTSNVTTMSSYVDSLGVYALPYLFHSEEDELEYLASADIAYDQWQELEDTAGLVTIGFQCSGSRCLSTKGVPQISCPDDLQGVKVRCMEAQVWQDVIAALGATPVPVAYTELYTALQTGVVSGQDNPATNTVDGRFYEVLDLFYETEHSYLISAFYSNTTAWDALPDDYKALLLALCEEYLGDQYKVDIDAFNDDCYTIMEDAGVAIVGQDELDMDAFYESASQMIDENYKSDEAMAPIIDDITETFGY